MADPDAAAALGVGYGGVQPTEAGKRLVAPFLDLVTGPSWLQQAGELEKQYPHDPTKMFQPGEVEARTEFATGMVGPEALRIKGVEGAAAKALKRDEGTAALQAPMDTTRKRAITAVNLREMPLDEATAIASTGQHIIPKTEGGFVGAPAGVRTYADLERMRAKFDEQVRAGLSGAPWYGEAQAGIRETAGPDPARQHLQARELALTSAQAAPDPNLGFTLQGHNAYEMGEPLSVVRTGQIAKSYRTAREAGKDIPLGKKTGVYAGHLDPTLEDPTTGTNDIWHARAFGYTNPDGKPWSKALTAQQHAFMDAETVLAVKRANDAGLGGRSNWTPGEIQAAPWVAGKAKGLEKTRKMSPEAATAEAAKTYPAYFPKYTAYGTHEATPGIGTGQLENIATGPEALRTDYSSSPLSQWKGEQPRDILYDALGGYQRETLPATGVFQTEGGPLEINPANVARPLVGMTGKSGQRVIDPASKQMLQTAEGVRAYVDVQNMGAASKPILGNQVRRSNSIWVPHDQKMTIEQIGQLNQLGESVGLPNIIDYGEGIVLTNFAGTDAKAISKAARNPHFTKSLGAILPGRPNIAELDSVTINYAKAFGNKQGTGAATRLLRKQIPNDAVLDKLDASKELRTAVLNRFNRDALAAAQGGGVAREDVQLARDIIVNSGFRGLFAALKSGAALPAALLPIAAGAVAASLREGE
jgi:hypothetical protein